MYLGITRTYYIPNLRKILLDGLKNCMICNQTKVKPKPSPIQAMVPAKPLSIWQFDYIEPFPEDTVKFNLFLNILIFLLKMKL